MIDNLENPKNVLIVEDDTNLNDTYRIILEKEGHNVECAMDGNQAIEKLNSFDPDIVLLDLRMPNLDGEGFLRESEFRTKFPDAIVIIFTNFDENAQIESAFELGANRYVLKSSIAPKDLVKLIRESIDQL